MNLLLINFNISLFVPVLESNTIGKFSPYTTLYLNLPDIGNCGQKANLSKDMVRISMICACCTVKPVINNCQ